MPSQLTSQAESTPRRNETTTCSAIASTKFFNLRFGVQVNMSLHFNKCP